MKLNNSLIMLSIVYIIYKFLILILTIIQIIRNKTKPIKVPYWKITENERNNSNKVNVK